MDEVIGTTLFTATSFLENEENYVIVASNLYIAQKIIAFLQSFIDESKLLFYPNDDLLQLDIISASKELEAQRLFTLNKLQSNNKYIIVTNVTALTRHTVSKQNFKEHQLVIEKDTEIEINKLVTSLTMMGYQRVNKVDQSLQFAVRGDIIDIYSLNSNNPIRIELFGNEVESIRTFEVTTQKSVTYIDKIEINPASEILLSSQKMEELTNTINLKLKKQQSLLSFEDSEKLGHSVESDLYLLSQRSATSKVYKYFCLSDVFNYSLLDHVDNANVVLANKSQINISYDNLWQEVASFLFELSNNYKTIPGLGYFKDLGNCLTSAKHIISVEEFATNKNDIIVDISPVPLIFPKLDDLVNEIKLQMFNGKNVIVSINNEAQKRQLEDAFTARNLNYELDNDFDKDVVHITYTYYPNGFELRHENVVIYTSKEIFNAKKNNLRMSTRFKSGQILNSYEQLNPGDYIVHEYHGIGQFVDVTTLLDEGVHRDFLKIAYAGTDVLYVPLEQFQLVRKYSGREGAVPRINKLNSGEWEKTKKRISKKIKEIADQLIKTQAERRKNRGFAFPLDDELQVAFENGFDYSLTVDQQESLTEIKQDMEKEEPMDRVLCGDVGFGKTEVAFRAAFKAIAAGKQVAMLCPTTLLARQHYEVAKQRFKEFGITIAQLSRLIPESLQKVAIENINNGKIDFIIGTHRILSKEIKYNDLGLLIVDEEQRFGVEQKEKIKQYKSVIDVLTLSATPIPRTLQMALVGMRGLSQINSAPFERMPIQTYVIPKNNAIIKELIEKELQREGQVFYLHNRVETIYQVSNRISKLTKSAVVGVVHGQMNKDEIEDVMIRFYNGEVNVLVCTSIIENGIDVANANMIIVENAASFGLAQLYQIKGRVGRGDRIGYAYLLYDEHKKISDDGRKRLKAIQEFTELGSGYKIAQRDLMIRGAGDLLGPEQAGFIDSIGIDLYLKMLANAIKNNNQEIEEEKIQSSQMLAIDAYIPEEYANKPDKIQLYQEIKAARTLKELKELEIKVIDIYGKMPDQVSLFFRKKRIDIIISAKVKFIEEVDDETHYIDVMPGSSFYFVPGCVQKLSEKLISVTGQLKVFPINGKIKLRIIKKDDWFSVYDKVINAISSVVLNYVKEQNEN